VANAAPSPGKFNADTLFKLLQILAFHLSVYTKQSQLYVQVGTHNLDVELERDVQVKIIFRTTACKVFWTRLYKLDIQTRGLTTERRITETLLYLMERFLAFVVKKNSGLQHKEPKLS